MTFYVENETNEQFPFNVEELISILTKEIIKTFNIPYDVSLNVSFTDDPSIREINKEFRGIDKSTDVLSFPALEFEKAGDFSNIKDDSPEYFDPDTNELILGDIMISLEHAHAQALEYGHSFKREIAFLITHSLLHLSGFDHVTEEERKVMEDLQRNILDTVGITRETD
jgi:probable rRNA maturation factor